MHCGEIFAGDIVLLFGDIIGNVCRFWQRCGTSDIVVELNAYTRVDGVASVVVSDAVSTCRFEHSPRISQRPA